MQVTHLLGEAKHLEDDLIKFVKSFLKVKFGNGKLSLRAQQFFQKPQLNKTHPRSTVGFHAWSGQVTQL
jgi:hypothetical protein